MIATEDPAILPGSNASCCLQERTGWRLWAPGAVVAACLAALWLFEQTAVPRPYWVLPTDIESDIAGNAFLLARGERLSGYWLPATPVYALGAAIVWLAKLSLGDVERLLFLGQVLTLLANVVSVVLFGKGMLSKGSFWIALAVTAAMWLHPSTLLYLTYFSENGFLLPVAFGSLWLLLRAVVAPPGLTSGSVLLAGVAAGFALTFKLIMLPLAAAGLGTLLLCGLFKVSTPISSTRERWLAWLIAGAWFLAAVGVTALVVVQGRSGRVALAAAGFAWASALGSAVLLLATTRWRVLGVPRVGVVYLSGLTAGYLMGTLPAMHLQPSILSHALDLVTRSGPYGSGRTVTIASVLGNVSNSALAVLARAPIWMLLTTLVLAGMIMVMVRSRASAGDRSLCGGVALGLILALAMAFASPTFGADGPTPGVSFRYLIPAVGLAVFGLALLVRLLHLRGGTASIAVGVSLLSLVAVGVQVIGEVENRQRRVDEGLRVKAAVDSALAPVLALRTVEGGPERVLFASTGRPSAFLWRASSYVESRLDSDVEHLYPKEHFLRRGCRTAVPNVDPVRYAALVDSRACIDEASWTRLAEQGEVRLLDVREECTLEEERTGRCGIVLYVPRGPISPLAGPLPMNAPAPH